jgi:hypothetical protein
VMLEFKVFSYRILITLLKPTSPYFVQCFMKHKSHDSSSGIALGYGLDDRGSRGSIPGRGW